MSAKQEIWPSPERSAAGGKGSGGVPRPGWLFSFISVFQREVHGICQSTGIVFFCFYVPVFWLLVVWGLLGDGVITRIPVAIIDNDRTPMSRELTRAMAAERFLGLETYLEPDTAFAAMRQGSIYGIILIPAGYERHSLRGEGASVAVWLDENRYAAGGTIQIGLSRVFQALKEQNLLAEIFKTGMTESNARRLISLVHADSYALGNTESSFLAFLGSTLMPSLIMIAAMFGFLTAFLRELFHKTALNWLACANERISAAVIGKLLPWYAMYALIFLFYMALFSGAGGFNITGSLLHWLVLGLCCLADFAATAIVIAALAPTWRLALVIGAGYAAPALPFSGFSMPLDSMSHAVKIFGQCLPLTWFIQAQAREWTLGAGLGDIGTAFAAMLIIFLAFFLPGLPLINWSYHRRAAKADFR